MTNKHQSIKNNVLAKIKSGSVKMKSKTHFVLQTLLVAGSIFVLSGFIIFLSSFIYFYLRSTGIWYLPGFGFHGMGMYLKYLPWVLIIISVILIFILEALAKRFSFVWRRPLFYSLLGIILFTVFASFIIEKQSFHSTLFIRSRGNRMPIITSIYHNLANPKFEDFHRGVVEEVREDSFMLKKIDSDELLTVLYDNSIIIKEGDSLLVVGEIENNMVIALYIKRINDRFRQL